MVTNKTLELKDFPCLCELNDTFIFSYVSYNQHENFTEKMHLCR